MKRSISLTLGAAMLALTTTAWAAPITYTFTGDLSGTIDNAIFSGPVTFVANADTTEIASDPEFAIGPLSAVKLISSGITYTITDPADLFSFPGGVAFTFTLGGSVGGSFGTGNTYDGLGNLAPIAVQSGSYGSFNTNRGVVSIGEISDLSFSAALGTVPEPATWSLMIVGLGLVGGVMRRQQLASRAS